MYCRANKERIGEIFVTLDSHHKKHIAHQAFWSSIENDAEGKGNEPAVFSHITEEDLLNGKWFPKDCSLQVCITFLILFFKHVLDMFVTLFSSIIF